MALSAMVAVMPSAPRLQGANRVCSCQELGSRETLCLSARTEQQLISQGLRGAHLLYNNSLLPVRKGNVVMFP